MSSSDEKSTDGGDDIPDSPTSDPFQSSAASVYMYPSPTSQTVRSKRNQVKNACTNCQKACKKCDPARPCLRCIKCRFTPEECVDSQRKERKKGVKRGPYKKRDAKGWLIEYMGKIITRSNGLPQPNISPPPCGLAAFAGSMAVEYATGTGFYGQFPLLPGDKTGYPHHPQFYLAPVPLSAGQGGEGFMYHHGSSQ
ncbi:hypothetical protein DFH08DRAFT_694911 [Mycena albidolilacea]|uniref:Zn(2)-C6 fungal-type domain-containing protein n=1 Tax=Mycena albidolilacea TaxID=1033008 RepID=A0AAD7A727_9AGAR|nr:hypothetical protein DFH08DRAFT_694911 [Mycena albidolilacea]